MFIACFILSKFSVNIPERARNDITISSHFAAIRTKFWCVFNVVYKAGDH